MHYRRFGKTELNLSVFSLGTMRCLDNADVLQQVLLEAVGRGINHIETARGYGQSECYIGQALKSLNREQLILTTKLLPGSDVDRLIDESLARLGTDYIDCLAVHGVNTPEHLQQVETMMSGLAQVLDDGRVRHVGASSHGPLEVVMGAIALPVVSFINLHYYFFNQRNAAAITLAHQRDLGIFIISPADKGGQLYTPPDTLAALCTPFDPLLLTYRWLLSDPRITTLSVGPAVPTELDWPLQVANQTMPLTHQEQAALDRLEQAQPKRLGTDHCRQCYECLPCPEAIHIPEILRLRNLAVAYDMTSFGQYRYGMFERAGHWFPGRKGSRCSDCGDCLPRCPEHLDIPTLLRDTHKRLKGAERRRLWSD
ncbi:aldo/keto reductase [Leptolyngbya cf. ectocarpi LEGE 11479]|uniref:Aldo/keto reductase n=1 Tax=Leptolyngbya cf. ectocarpi LEGE 11479 TaxID=1828722 RepID=A0A928ZYD7_LEPEC|nr:aldo/keto reductase [Leptolyngbya ectocarpi]MBE9069706.1 aldo/keto reductase [Leptolyngbya cf. ectocarpi LEGE 11479]